MKTNSQIIHAENVRDMIFTIRGVQVMLDSDLAKLYGVETKYLNRAVNRNIERFPERYRFQLTKEEWKTLLLQINSRTIVTKKDAGFLRFQNGASKSKRGGKRYLPYVFTEHGVAMLSAVLRSDYAVQVSIKKPGFSYAEAGWNLKTLLTKTKIY